MQNLAPRLLPTSLSTVAESLSLFRALSGNFAYGPRGRRRSSTCFCCFCCSSLSPSFSLASALLNSLREHSPLLPLSLYPSKVRAWYAGRVVLRKGKERETRVGAARGKKLGSIYLDGRERQRVWPRSIFVVRGYLEFRKGSGGLSRRGGSVICIGLPFLGIGIAKLRNYLALREFRKDSRNAIWRSISV